MSDEGTWNIEPEQIAERTELEIETVKIALWALAGEHPPFFDYFDRTSYAARLPNIGGIQNPTGHARRKVGTWPSPEDRVIEMVAALRQAAEREPDLKKKSFLRKAAEYFAGLPRDAALAMLVSGFTGG